jgi:hypothetical protein
VPLNAAIQIDVFTIRRNTPRRLYIATVYPPASLCLYEEDKCVTIDASLLAEAEEAAARLNVPLSALVEEALRRLLRQAEAWRDVEEKLANIEALLRQCLQKEARRELGAVAGRTQSRRLSWAATPG